MKDQIAALSLTLALSVGLCAPAQAADSQTVQATLNAGITVTMDGTPQTFHDAQGAVVLPVTYNGTTYLPVRAVSALVGLGVEWEAETQTVKLTTPEDPTPTTSPADGTGDGPTSQTVPALLNGAITVTLDGVAQTFHDAQGAVVLPLTYNGTTYLPVRAVCGLVGLPVEWVQETSTVKLGEAPSTIPEGVTVLSEKSDFAGFRGAEITDGSIHMNPDLVMYGYGSFVLETNNALTFNSIITAGDIDTYICVYATKAEASRFEYGELIYETVVEANEQTRVAFDCSNYARLSISTMDNKDRASFGECWFSNIYLL